MRNMFNSSTIKQLTGREVAGMVMHHYMETLHTQPLTFPDSELDRAVDAVRRNPGSDYGYWGKVVMMAAHTQSEARISALETKSIVDVVIMTVVARFIEDRSFAPHKPSRGCASCKEDAEKRLAYYGQESLQALLDQIAAIKAMLKQYGRICAILQAVGEVVGCNKLTQHLEGESSPLQRTIVLYNKCAEAANFQIKYNHIEWKRLDAPLLLPLLPEAGYMPPASFSNRVKELLLSKKETEAFLLMGDDKEEEAAHA